jgi:hypothetical protein
VQTDELLLLLKLNKRTIRMTERLKARWYAYAAILALKTKVKITRMKL